MALGDLNLCQSVLDGKYLIPLTTRPPRFNIILPCFIITFVGPQFKAKAGFVSTFYFAGSLEIHYSIRIAHETIHTIIK